MPLRKIEINNMIRHIIDNAFFQKRILDYNIKKKVHSFPSLFQIQTINSCNGNCIMCPNSQNKNFKPELMPNKLFEKIVNEISKEKSKHTYIYTYLQNEPLMDNDIFKKIKLIKDISNGRIKTGLVTNGTLFNKEKIKELEESEVDILLFSLDAFSEETYNKIRKGFNFKTVLNNLNNVIISDYNGILRVGFIKQKDNISELKDFKKFWKKNRLWPHISYIHNRSGDLYNFDKICLNKKDTPFLVRLKHNIYNNIVKCCENTLVTFNILFNGDVILCCNDYSKKLIFGNVKKSTIKKIWNSDKYQTIRKLLYNKSYEKISVCSNCSKIRNISFTKIMT